MLAVALCGGAYPQPVKTANGQADIQGPAGLSAKASAGDPKAAANEMTFGTDSKDGKLLISTEKGYLDYDQERDVIYANERTTVKYGGMTLEADSMHIDVRLREVAASGNVHLTGGTADVYADSIRYDLRNQAGEARGVRGNVGVLYFRHRQDEKDGPASFERLGEAESRVVGAHFTTCDFAKPMYYIKAREVLVEHGERVFMKGATLYVHDVPVFYFPVFSRSLTEGSPWSVFVGYQSGIGPWARLRYTYEHQTREPSIENDDEMETTAQGKLELSVDWMGNRGPGAGLRYKYDFDRGRHRGDAQLYFLNDSNRPIGGDQSYTYWRYTRSPGGTLLRVAGSERTKRYEEESSLGRYQANIVHRSQLTEHLTWLVNTDWHSDPELYDEVLDLFNQIERRRVMTRRARTALTWAREQGVARLLFEIKDRIGRDRLSNFSNPGDNDRDYDEQPELDEDDREDEAIPTSRWGHASIRSPQVTVATTWLKLWNLPLYYHTDLNLFNNLDKGINTVDTADDAWVRGGDWYNALMWRWQFAERFTLMVKLGAGAGVASRESPDFEEYLGDDALYPVVLYGAEGQPEGGLEFIDRDTFLIGSEEFSYDDVSPSFFYADAQVRLHGRLTDSLSTDLYYRYRYASEDSLGDWYAQMGNQSVREDLYNFRLREHNVEARARYDIAQPRLSLGGQIYRNLVSEGELYPNELISRYAVWGSWASMDDTLKLSAYGGLSERQIYHPSDSRSYIDSSMDLSASVSYNPLSERWWTRWSATYSDQLDRSTGNGDKSRFEEDETKMTLDGRIGARVGPKWKAEVGGEYDSRMGSLRRVRLTFNRDLHDALLLLMLGFERDIYDDDDDDNSGTLNSLDVRFALQPKLPGGGAIQGVPGITTLQGGARGAEIARF